MQGIKVKNQVQVKKDQNCTQKDIISHINRLKRGYLMTAEGRAVTRLERADGTRWRGNKFTVHYESFVLDSHNSSLGTWHTSALDIVPWHDIHEIVLNIYKLWVQSRNREMFEWMKSSLLILCLHMYMFAYDCGGHMLILLMLIRRVFLKCPLTYFLT